MNTYLWNALAVYVIIAALAAVWLILVMAYEDLFKGPDEKFGYNFKSSFSYVLVLVQLIPLVNIYIWVSLLVIITQDRLVKDRDANSV